MDSIPDDVIVIAAQPNVPPTAHAGPDQSVATGSRVFLIGTGSFDPDGDPLTFLWQFLTLPADSHTVLDDPTSPTPSFLAGPACSRSGLLAGLRSCAQSPANPLWDQRIVRENATTMCYHNAILLFRRLTMPQILIRDLDDGLVERLKRQAKRHHRSLQGEVKAILIESARMTPEEMLAAAEDWQRRLAGRKFSDSALLVREDRGR